MSVFEELIGLRDRWRKASSRWPSSYDPPSASGCADELDAILSKYKSDAFEAIPTSWLDPLLTGPEQVIGKPPYNGSDIERLLNAIRERVAGISEEEAA